MSYSLKLVDGDLVQKGSQLEIVSGLDKLLQDLDCWLRERYGGDRFHQRYGSTLQEYIGGVVDDSSRREVQSEVLRVLNNYMKVQYKLLRENPQLLGPSEILVSVDAINTAVYYDSIIVQIKIRNLANQSKTLTVGQSV